MRAAAAALAMLGVLLVGCETTRIITVEVPLCIRLDTISAGPGLTPEDSARIAAEQEECWSVPE